MVSGAMGRSCQCDPEARAHSAKLEAHPFLFDECPLGFSLFPGFGINWVRKMLHSVQPLSFLLLPVFYPSSSPTSITLIPYFLFSPMTSPPPPISRDGPVPPLIKLSERKLNWPHALWAWQIFNPDSFPCGSFQVIFESFHLQLSRCGPQPSSGRCSHLAGPFSYSSPDIVLDWLLPPQALLLWSPLHTDFLYFLSQRKEPLGPHWLVLRDQYLGHKVPEGLRLCCSLSAHHPASCESPLVLQCECQPPPTSLSLPLAMSSLPFLFWILTTAFSKFRKCLPCRSTQSKDVQKTWLSIFRVGKREG